MSEPTTREELIESLADVLSPVTYEFGEDATRNMARQVLDHVQAVGGSALAGEPRMPELVVLSQHYEMLLEAATERRQHAWHKEVRARLDHLQAKMDGLVGYQND